MFLARIKWLRKGLYKKSNKSLKCNLTKNTQERIYYHVYLNTKPSRVVLSFFWFWSSFPIYFPFRFLVLRLWLWTPDVSAFFFLSPSHPTSLPFTSWPTKNGSLSKIIPRFHLVDRDLWANPPLKLVLLLIAKKSGKEVDSFSSWLFVPLID